MFQCLDDLLDEGIDTLITEVNPVKIKQFIMWFPAGNHATP
jgi:hypothetical protein